MEDREDRGGGRPESGDRGPFGWEDEERGWERRRDPDLEAEAGEEPPRDPSEAPVPRIGSRYTAVVGVLFILILIVAGINAFSNRGSGARGLAGEDSDLPLAEFVVADARGGREGDANIFQDDCATSQLPCPPEARRKPACQVRGEGIINACDLFDRPLVISFWFTRGAPGCVPQQDAVDRVARRYRGRVNFLSLDVRDSRDKVRDLIGERGWSMPVGLDPDGAVSNVYRVSVCPEFVYAYPGGILQDATIGELDEAGLSRRVDELIAASRRRTASDR